MRREIICKVYSRADKIEIFGSPIQTKYFPSLLQKRSHVLLYKQYIFLSLPSTWGYTP
jgi:hypothetical protein